MRRELNRAEQVYLKSIQACATAEAHTFLGWTYSFQGRYAEAMAECQKAILLDPDFGNPTTTSELISSSWAGSWRPFPGSKARSKLPDTRGYHYPYFNLARVYQLREMYNRAIEWLEKASEIAPDYELARTALSLKKKVH